MFVPDVNNLFVFERHILRKILGKFGVREDGE
jgi:hypothetical protein